MEKIHLGKMNGEFRKALEEDGALVQIDKPKEQLEEMRWDLRDNAERAKPGTPGAPKKNIARHIENMIRTLDFECKLDPEFYKNVEVECGAVYPCALNYQTQGSEIRGEHPVVVVSRTEYNRNSTVVLVAVITHKSTSLEKHWRNPANQFFPPEQVPIFDWGGRYLEGVVDIGQIYTVAKKRLFNSMSGTGSQIRAGDKKGCWLPAENMRAVYDALAYHMGMPGSSKPRFPKDIRETYQKAKQAEAARTSATKHEEVVVKLEEVMQYESAAEPTEAQPESQEVLTAATAAQLETLLQCFNKGQQQKKSNASPDQLQKKLAKQTERAERKDRKIKAMRALVAEAGNLLQSVEGADGEADTVARLRELMNAALELKEEHV